MNSAGRGSGSEHGLLPWSHFSRSGESDQLGQHLWCLLAHRHGDPGWSHYRRHCNWVGGASDGHDDPREVLSVFFGGMCLFRRSFVEQGNDMSDEFLTVMLLVQSVALGLAAYQLRKLTEVFIELAERIDKWDEAMRARTWIFKQVKSNEQQRGSA